MDTVRAEHLLHHHMGVHGLTERGWSARFDDAVTRFGACSSTRKRISLSRRLSALNDEDEVVDTILHEIAHALAFEAHGEDCNHDARWKAICRRIGARPAACYDEAQVTPVPGAWNLVHCETAEVFRHYHRLPARRDRSGVWIRGRRAETYGKLVVVTASELERMRARLPRAAPKPPSEPLLTLDRATVKLLDGRIAEALRTIADELGLTLKVLRSRVKPTSYTPRLLLTLPPADTALAERAAFATHAARYGLSADDYGRAFEVGGKRYTLTGLVPKRPKFPVQGRSARGVQYKFPVAVLERLERTG